MAERSRLFVAARPPGARLPAAGAASSASHSVAAPRLPYPARPAAILGVPLDRTTSYRSGTETGPAEIRAASWSLESYSPTLGADLEDVPLYDFGDVTLDRSRSLEADLEAVERTVAGVCDKGFLPVIIGGEHLLTLPAYKAAAGEVAASSAGEVAAAGTARTPRAPLPFLFHYDAHADLREEYDGLALSHATVIRRVAELAGGRRVYQFGVRSGGREEMLWGEANTNRLSGDLVEATREALRAAAGGRVYVSVDIDLLDPSHAPGTGNPEPGGPPVQELLGAMTNIGAAAVLGAGSGGIDLVGFDLVEVSPPLDPSGRTAVLAAKILREFIIARGAASVPAGR